MRQWQRDLFRREAAMDSDERSARHEAALAREDARRAHVWDAEREPQTGLLRGAIPVRTVPGAASPVIVKSAGEDFHHEGTKDTKGVRP